MKGFKFKLQSVLGAKEKKFEDSQLEFAKVKNRLNNEEQALDNLHKDLKNTKNGLENIINSGILDYTFIFCHQNYISKLNEDIKNQHKLIKKIEQELKEKSCFMLEARKEKTMMEKLREKAMEEFREKTEKQDLINIDEIATNRYKKIG